MHGESPLDSNPPASDDDNSMPALPNTSRAVFLDATRSNLNESINDEHTKLWGNFYFEITLSNDFFFIFFILLSTFEKLENIKTIPI